MQIIKEDGRMNRSIFEVCPDIVGVNLLYVGFNRHIPSQGIEYKKWWYDLFVSKGFSKFTILEIFSICRKVFHIR